MNDIVEQIARWFTLHGDDPCRGPDAPRVTALEHALQTAQLAEYAHAEASLVVAALLHDIGHFAALGAGAGPQADAAHEVRGAEALAGCFPPSVVEPVRLHVDAKRYLTAIDPTYRGRLSAASQQSLQRQGGPMSVDERRRFANLPYSDEAVMLRRWDDRARVAGATTPPLEHFLAMIGELLAPPALAVTR